MNPSAQNEVKSKTTFMDFLDFCERRIANLNDEFLNRIKDNPSSDLSAGLSFWSSRYRLRNSHIFYLGKEDELSDSIKTVQEDLVEEWADRFPLPFSDVSCITMSEKTGWSLTRFILLPNSSNPDPSVVQSVLILRILEPVPFVMGMHGIHRGRDSDGYPSVALRADAQTMRLSKRYGEENHLDDKNEFVFDIMTPSFFHLAMISHPMNYLVKTSPKLTTKEQHWVESGKRPIPIRKTPHFIVVDHTVLVRMRNGEHGDDQEGELDRASPVPHHRRGHWARLAAERFRHARLLGKNRVWKRPTFVGDRKFEDDRNYYEVVIPDGSKQEISA